MEYVAPVSAFHLLAAFRYVARGPVKAGLATAAVDWPWSSAAAHTAGKSTPHVDDFAAFVADEADDAAQWSALPTAEQVGRPVGARAWIEGLEKQHGRTLSPARRGPKLPLAASPKESGELFGD